MVRRLLAIFFLILGINTLKGQDIHFSMYDFAPLALNPGETGYFEGDWRGTVNYRQQWKSLGDPFQTVAAAYDQNLYFLPGQFSAGLFFVNDQSGSIGLNHNRVYLSLAYKKQTAVWDYSFGAQMGLIIKSFKLDGTTFPEQYNDNIGAFDPNLPLSEQGLGNQRTYFDMNIGGVVTRKFKTASVKFGLSAVHLNSPDVSFFKNKEKLPPRINSYVQVNKDINATYFVRPMLIVATQNKAQEILLGGDIGMYTGSERNSVKEIYVGVDVRDGFNRNGDAFIASMGLSWSDFRFGLSYDVNYSSLDKATNNRGAIEFSVVYISPSSAIKKITIPCDRY